MITKIRVRNFKSFRETEDLQLGRVNLFIGTNASGKSNFLEVLQFLQGLGNELTVPEILNGKPKGATHEAWDGLRGGAPAIPFWSGKEAVTAIECVLVGYDNVQYEYRIEFEAMSGAIQREHLRCNGMPVFDADVQPGHDDEVWVTWYDGQDGKTPTDSCPLEFPSKPSGSILGRSALSLTIDRDRPSYPVAPRSKAVMAVLRVFSNQQWFDPQADVLRKFSSDQPVRRMGKRGEEFAALVKGLMPRKETRDDYVSWLKELTPSEVDDVDLITADREVRFAIRRAGRQEPESAKVLSDGTLRFAAMSAAFFQPDMPRILLLEEVETHLHPARIRLVADLLLNQSKQTGTQVFATTHSPKVVDWLLAFKDEALRVLHFYRDEETGATLIRPLDSLIKSERTAEMAPVGDLMADGWMEVPA